MVSATRLELHRTAVSLLEDPRRGIKRLLLRRLVGAEQRVHQHKHVPRALSASHSNQRIGRVFDCGVDFIEVRRRDAIRRHDIDGVAKRAQ